MGALKSESARSVSEETSKSHAHDDATHAMTMTRTGLRAVERCGRVPYDYNKDSRDSVTMAPRRRTEKKLNLSIQEVRILDLSTASCSSVGWGRARRAKFPWLDLWFLAKLSVLSEAHVCCG